MARFASNLQNQAVGKTQRRSSAKAGHGSGHGFRILNRQMLVVEEHLDGGGDVLRTTVVNRRLSTPPLQPRRLTFASNLEPDASYG